MIFSSLIFLFLFFPVTLICYYLANPKYKNVMLLLASIAFYAWGEPKYIFDDTINNSKLYIWY